MATFDRQSHLEMPPTGRLDINGHHLSPDTHQQTSDYRTKHGTSPVSPLLALPLATIITDGQSNSTQYPKVENIDLAKKIFMDRQIKKAKALAGLMKGGALSRQSTLHSALSNTNSDDTFFTETSHNEEDTSLTRQEPEQTNETRRFRVSFSDFDKVQYFEGDNDPSQQASYRRHRYRSAKKPTTAAAGNIHISPSSIQRSQTLNNAYLPLSRQQMIEQESNTRKQQLLSSARAYSTRMTHLPDIVNQPVPTELPVYEKYGLQREKPFLRIPEPAAEIPINTADELPLENTRIGPLRSSVLQDYNDQNYKIELGDNSSRALLSKSSTSSSLSSRQRPTLRTISLRQQFTPSSRSKTPNTPSTHQPVINPRRSSSLKHSATRTQASDDDLDEINNTELLSAFGHRPMTASSSLKQIKRNYMTHFDSRSPFNGSTTNDFNEANQHSKKSTFNELPQERYRDVFKIVRSPYGGSINDSSSQTTMTNTSDSVRTSRTSSRHGSGDFHVISNTIFV